MNYLVGLTGGIGSGKSAVAELFAAQGVRIIDTDALAHELTQAGGSAIPAIRQAFGTDYITPDMSLNRSKMRELVFSDPVQKKKLQDILHPLILRQTQQQAQTPTSASYTMIVVPLLFESGAYANWLQRTVTVDCPEETQIQRTMQRSALSEDAVRAIMAQQLERAERLRLADEIIHNDGSLEELRTQVGELHRRFCLLAAESN